MISKVRPANRSSRSTPLRERPYGCAWHIPDLVTPPDVLHQFMAVRPEGGDHQ
jgi:hypothetical protein